MLNRAKEVFDGLGQKWSNWRGQRRAAQPVDPPGVTVPLWLVNATKFASWVATASLIYFLFLYTLDVARDRAGALHITHAGQWIGDIKFWFPYIVGFAIIAFGIPYVAKIAIPTFMSLSWRGNFWPKLWSLVIALAVSSVVIMGTFAVQGDTIMERDREAAVAVEGVQQEAAVLSAQIADVQHAMDERLRSTSVYVRTAASMSPEAYDRFVEARRNDWQYERLRSYRAVSEEMVALNQRMSELRAQQARQTTVASVQGEVVTERTSWIADTMGWLEGVRAILLSLVMDIVALMMPWIALRLEQARNRQVGMADGIPQHPWMLQDKRAEGDLFRNPARRSAQDVVDAMIAGGADPRFAADMARAAARSGVTREAMYDAETGEELVPFKGGWRRKPKKKGAPEQMQMPPGDPQPDETGVTVDGGGRIGSVPAPEENAHNVPSEPAQNNEQGAGYDAEAKGVEQIDESRAHPELSPDEMAALQELAPDAPVDVTDAEPEREAGGEDDGEGEHSAPPTDGIGDGPKADATEAEQHEDGQQVDGDLPELLADDDNTVETHESLPQRDEPESRHSHLLEPAK